MRKGGETRGTGSMPGVSTVLDHTSKTSSRYRVSLKN